MTGKALTENLRAYLDSILAINVYSFDSNEEKVLPCVVVGYDNEINSIAGNICHYTVSAYINICYQGYDDRTNSSANVAQSDIITAMNNRNALFGAINKPEAALDERPVKNFHCNQIFLRGAERSIEGNSTEISIKIDAFCTTYDI